VCLFWVGFVCYASSPEELDYEILELREQVQVLNNTLHKFLDEKNQILDSYENALLESEWTEDRTIEEVFKRVDAEEYCPSGVDTDKTVIWVSLSAFLIFFMQTGFGMLEAGTVGTDHVKDLLLQKLLGSAVTAFGFWFFGFAIAFGDQTFDDNPYIGTNNYFFSLDPNLCRLFVFHWVYSSNTASIISGGIAERSKLIGYLIIAFFIAAIVHPAPVHWTWSHSGFMSAYNSTNDFLGTLGFIDYAGAACVHAIGGIFGLVGAIVVGKRKYIDKGRPRGVAVQSLGVFILWYGWYGFNCGSVRDIWERSVVVKTVAVNMTVATACSTLAAFAWRKFMASVQRLLKKKNILKRTSPRADDEVTDVLNAILSGLVSITGCSGEIEPWSAAIVGFVSYFVYRIFSYIVRRCKVDDPLDCFAIHTGCGFWGIIGIGLFAQKKNLEDTYSTPQYDYDFSKHYGLFIGGGGRLLGIQLLGFSIIALWSLLWAILLFVPLRYTKLLLKQDSPYDPDFEEVSRENSEIVGKGFSVNGVDSDEYGDHYVSINSQYSPPNKTGFFQRLFAKKRVGNPLTPQTETNYETFS